MFTTLDLCNINLANARMKLIKYGANPSYHIRSGMVEKLQLIHYQLELFLN